MVPAPGQKMAAWFESLSSPRRPMPDMTDAIPGPHLRRRNGVARDNQITDDLGS
jgi:hypothetical protein